MTRDELIKALKYASAIHVRAGRIKAMMDVDMMNEIIAELSGEKTAFWVVSDHHKPKCSHCGAFEEVKRKYCPECGWGMDKWD